MRQLFTNSPFIKTEQEPHSPSPQPSFVPVNPRPPRRTSTSLAMGWTRTVSGLPFTVRESSHLPRFSLPRSSLARSSEEWLIVLRRRRLVQRYLPGEVERSRSEFRGHLRSR